MLFGEISVARRNWLIVTFIVVLLFPLTLNTPNLPIPRGVNAVSNSPQYSPPPPYGGESVGRYTGNGPTTGVTATYNKTLSTPTSSDISTDFSVTLPVNWDIAINASFTSLTANPVVLDVETADSTIDGSLTIRAAMSFQITNSCYLHSVMVRVEAGLFELLDIVDDFYVWIYNATNDSGRPKPHMPWSTRVFKNLGDSTDTFNGWINATWASSVLLNSSTTYNGYYFAVLVPESGATVHWQYRTDASNGDNGYAWQGTGSWGTDPIPIDYFLNVSLLPMGTAPKPSQVSMQVNASSVTDAVANAGWWASSFTASSSPTLFDVTATWPVTFDYTYIALFTQMLVGTTRFQTDYQLSLAIWNITTSVSFPNVNANANSRTINFSIPAHWQIQALLNGTTMKSITDYKDNSTNPGLPGYLFIDEPNGAGNGTLWRAVSSDLNYVQTPVIRRDGLDVTGQEVNITDTLVVSAQVSTFTDGQGRFNPYDELGISLNEWLQTPDGGGLLTFASFTPSSYAITNVTMRCEVIWNNTYHVGVGVSAVFLVYPTTVVDDLGPYTSLIGDNVNIRVYYEDSYNTAGIENAEVNVTFGLSTYTLSDIGGGYYQSALDTLAMNLGRGLHTGTVSADRAGYDAAFTSVSLTLWSKTQLVSNWTTLSISYTETVTLEVNYSIFTPLGEGGIEDAQVNITGSSFFSVLTQSSGGNYSVILDGTVLDVGTHILIVNASKPGNYLQNNTLVVTLTVQGEPTTITGGSPSTVNGGDFFNVTVTYRKVSDGTGITGASVSCLLNDTPSTAFILFDLNNGTYKVQFRLNVTGSSSTFNITLTVSRSGYNPATYQTLIDVLIHPANLNVMIQSGSPLIYDSPFTLLVTYTDLSAQGLLNALVQGNWTTINTLDNGDGTYTVRCVTTGASVGYWSISFNISVDNYEYKFFTESFHLVWPTSLTPENNDYTPSEYQNESLILDVTFTNTELGSGITSATVWAVFQSTTYPFTPVGGGVYRLSLDLMGVSPSSYNLEVFAQRTHHENQTISLTLGVLAKLNPILTVHVPPDYSPGQEIPITITLTFPNGTAIAGANLDVVVWMHHANGTDVTLLSDTVTTDLFGIRILIIELPSYPEDVWSNGNDPPEVWANATYLGSRELAYITVSNFSALTPPSPLPWWVELLLMLLPFIVIIVIIAIIGRIVYVKRVRPKRLARQMEVEETGGVWAQRMMGLMDLRALFVMYAQTGLPIFTYNFTGGEMPSALLSGFISAVNSFYSELSGELDRETQLRDIHYKDLHLSLREGKHVVSVLILDASPSQEITESLAQFSSKFETQFADDLSSFDGRIDVFNPARVIVEDCFHSELLLSYECVHAPSRGFARKVYDLAVKIANTEGRLFLPQLFIAAVEKFGPDKKFAVASALELLHTEGCLVPAHQGGSPEVESIDEPTSSGKEG